jgi:hypothetical protein
VNRHSSKSDVFKRIKGKQPQHARGAVASSHDSLDSPRGCSGLGTSDHGSNASNPCAPPPPFPVTPGTPQLGSHSGSLFNRLSTRNDSDGNPLAPLSPSQKSFSEVNVLVSSRRRNRGHSRENNSVSISDSSTGASVIPKTRRLSNSSHSSSGGAHHSCRQSRPSVRRKSLEGGVHPVREHRDAQPTCMSNSSTEGGGTGENDDNEEVRYV